MCLYGRTSDPPKIPVPAPAVKLRITIQEFLPPAAAWRTDPIIEPRHRGEISHHQDEGVRTFRFPYETDDALLCIMDVDPLESRRGEIELMERRFKPAELIQISYPALDTLVHGVLQ